MKMSGCGQQSLEKGHVVVGDFSEGISEKRGRLSRRCPGKDNKRAEGQGERPPWDQSVEWYRYCRRASWLEGSKPEEVWTGHRSWRHVKTFRPLQNLKPRVTRSLGMKRLWNWMLVMGNHERWC